MAVWPANEQFEKLLDRRCRLLWLNEEILLHAILGWGQEVVPRYRIEGLPDGWSVAGIRHDPYRACFGVLIEHETFAQVEEGSLIPEFDGEEVCMVAVEQRGYEFL